MYATLEEMKKINNVQLDLFKATVDACEKLHIKWFMVHGSLLGTICNSGFVPYDDDIDIAMSRKDYERFLKEAPALIGKDYFIQSNISDKHYPLLFAKVRDSRTTYICERVRNIDMHHGIYIDIFPIDRSISKDKVRSFLLRFFSLRCSVSMYWEKPSAEQKLKKMIMSILCPSVRGAIRMSEALLRSARASDKVTITGGKPQEGALPAAWFESSEERRFEGIKVFVPAGYDESLRLIYGEYETFDLVADKMVDDKVLINAHIVDVEKPYTAYMIK